MNELHIVLLAVTPFLLAAAVWGFREILFFFSDGKLATFRPCNNSEVATVSASAAAVCGQAAFTIITCSGGPISLLAGFLACSAVSASRVARKKHTMEQVILGALFGLSSVYFGILFLNQIGVSLSSTRV